MKFDLGSFRKDEDLINAGVRVPMGSDASITVRSFDYAPFVEDFRRAIKPYQDLGREIPEEDQNEIMVRLIVKHLLLDWENIFIDDELVPFSAENAKRVLTEFPKFRDMVVAEMRRLENFRAKKREETEGN